MLGAFVMHNHVGLYVSTAADNFAFQANPVFFSVTAVLARSCDRKVLEFFDWGNVFPCDTVRTFFDWLASKESHDIAFFFIHFRSSFFVFFYLFTFLSS
jgi:hypothetical protein